MNSNPYHVLHMRLQTDLDLGNISRNTVDRWDAFYSDAWAFCSGLATETQPLGATIGPSEWAGRIADACAALSPLKPWDLNMRLTVDAVEAFTNGDAAMTHVGAMRSRKDAARRALEGNGVTGPKVAAFALAIKGDPDAVVIDRHMAAIASPGPVTARSLAACVDMMRDACPDDLAPAVFQARLWGYWRHLKGYPTY